MSTEQQIADLTQRGRESLAIKQHFIAARGIFPQLTDDECAIIGELIARAGHDPLTLGIVVEWTPASAQRWEALINQVAEANVCARVEEAQAVFLQRFALTSI